MIGGFERPTTGRVLLRGEDLTGAAPEDRPFNMVFQSYALFPHMSVADNVGYGPRVAGEPAPETRRNVDRMLELVHLKGFGSRAVSEISGGQQQRVALARALINEPDVLLLDEPLGALDLQLRRRLQLELREIQRRLGTTFVYVTHDQEEALFLSHRIAVMQAGRLIQVSDTRGLYERPATRFVAEFVGDANLVECEVLSERDGRVEVRLGAGTCELSHHGSPGLSSGSRALAVLRPHYIELAEPTGSQLSGSVTQSVFLGDILRVEVAIGGGERIEVDVAPEREIAEGETVGIRIKPGCGSVVRAEDDAAAAAKPRP
jgi:ABC-type Fe3+/spermidine/putrescine transport system ATPase subunit